MCHQSSQMTSVSGHRTLESRSRRSQGRRFKVRSLELLEPSGIFDSSSGTSWKSPGWFSQASSLATSTQRPLPSPLTKPGTRMKILKENSFQKLEAETNVDTGFTIINSKPRQSCLSKFPRDLGTSQPPSCLPGSSLEVAPSQNKRVIKAKVLPLSLGGKRDLGARKTMSECSYHLPVQDEEKEEFFI